MCDKYVYVLLGYKKQEEYGVNIYICDDCLGDIARLKRYLDRYAAEKGFLFTIREFTSAFEMLKVWSVVPDIIFLDIYMQDIDGMQAANLIKNRLAAAGSFLLHPHQIMQ